MPSLPTIAVIIPSLNGLAHLKECLPALAASRYPADRLEIVVADNGSTDGTLPWLAAEWPKVRVAQSGRAVGFGRACNAGAAATGAEWLAFLNNDTRVDPGWLRALLAAARLGEGAACVAAHLKTWDGAEEDFNGAAANLFGSGKQQFVAGWPDRPGPAQAGDPILFACGAAMLIRREVFLEAGGFDPGFFMYFEDVDLGWRLWVLGQRVVYAPDAVVYHRGGGTTGADRAPSHRRYVQFEANTLATIFKNYEQATLDRVLSGALMLELTRARMAAGEHINLTDYTLHGSRAGAPAVGGHAALPRISFAHVLGTGEWVRRLPLLLAERARIAARRRRSDAEILPLFGRPFAPQFAGPEYLAIQRGVAAALDLYPLVADSAPNRVLVLSGPDAPSLDRAREVVQFLAADFHVALATTHPGGGARIELPAAPGAPLQSIPAATPAATLAQLVAGADLLVAVGSGLGTPGVQHRGLPVVFDVTPLAAGDAALHGLAARADLLLAATEAQAAGWAGAGVPVVTEWAELAAFARYPTAGGA